MNKVVVIGGDHHNTLGVIESLGEKNIHSYALLYTKYPFAFVKHSKYVVDGWCCKDEKEIITTLLFYFKDSVDKSIIITTNDTVADIIDRHHQELQDNFYLPTTIPEGSLSKCMSKEYMSELARTIGMNVPNTWIIKEGVIPDAIDYPIITKAISSVVGAKDNIEVCNNENELRTFLDKSGHAPVIQVQKFVEKEFEFQLIGCSFHSGEHVFIPGRTHIDRPKGMDNTFFLKFDSYESEFEETVQLAVEFVKQTKYSGLFSIEFLRDKNNGLNYFTEMNFRNDGNAYCVTKAGINLPYLYYLSLVGGDYKTEIENSRVHAVYLCPEIYYFTCLLSGELSFKEWFNNTRKSDCYTTYFKDDKSPFFWFLWYAIKKRLFHK